jgi:hypothetical protein
MKRKNYKPIQYHIPTVIRNFIKFNLKKEKKRNNKYKKIKNIIRITL